MAYRSFSWADLRALLSFSQPIHDHSSSLFSPQNSYNSYLRYRQLSSAELARARSSYSTIGRKHKRIGYDIGYTAKLNTLAELTDKNALVTDAIASLAARDLVYPITSSSVGSADLARVRESLKHFVRDWSVEGAEERDRIFRPILDALRRTVDQRERHAQKVLLPGSGLCRLAWEISELGFDTTANEISFFMNHAFDFLASPDTTREVDQHVIHPYAHWFSHQRSNANLFRPVRFPDVVPRLAESRLRVEHGDFFSISPETHGLYDFIVTLFFIDTSTNIIATLEHVHALLQHGGTWINLGPLLWTSGGQAKLELSLEEVILAAKAVGFSFIDGDDGLQTVECEYTGDRTAMMRWVYKAEFWIATKSTVRGISAT